MEKSGVFSARAKINLSLDVIGTRPDGYHEMRMVMQLVSLHDEITIRLRDDGQFHARSGLRYLPGDERNLAVRAAKLFFRERGLEGLGADITLKKSIPVGAGLGGGSADAAGVLRALALLTGERVTGEELEKMGESLGSDVPFCLRGGTALAEGRGEALTDLPPLPDCSIVIAKPAFSISTPELFAELDKSSLRCHPDTPGLLAALEQGDLPGLARRMYNVFEDVLPRRYQAVFTLKDRLLDGGALGVCMSGTGSAVFGLFADRDQAERAKESLAELCRDRFVTEPAGKNV